jgi:membrane protein required for beta-lactamase induction
VKLIALLIGLAVERLATQLFHLRELRWLDRIIDAGFAQIERIAGWPPLLLILAIAIVLALPVLIVRLMLGNALFGFPYLLFAIVVLFFSFGPQDITEEVDEHCGALSADDSEQVRATAKALLERDPPDDPEARIRAVEEAVCVQGNDRLFAVVFWFIVLGPPGAWGYRVTDLIRRRAVFRSARDPDGELPASLMVGAAEDLQGWIAWVPARLTAASYAMAGSFDGAFTAWRTRSRPAGLRARELNELLLARVGVGALALEPVVAESIPERGIRGAMAARRLVLRALFIWAAVIAAMTLYGWSV